MELDGSIFHALGPFHGFWWPAARRASAARTLTAPEHRDVARPWPAWWSNGRHRSPGTGPGFVGKRWVLPYENQMKSIETWGLDGFTIGFTRWNPLKSDQLGENWPKKIDLKLVSHCLTFCFSNNVAENLGGKVCYWNIQYINTVFFF